jgi:oxalate decarboxylase
MSSSSRHVFHLAESEPFFENNHGTIQRVTATELPILNGMSLKRLILEAKGIREPHWHSNTPELSYCVNGSALVGIIDSLSNFSSFVIKAGQMFHVESGSLHYIENISDTESVEFLVCFRDETPKDFSLGAAFGAMTPAVLGNTWNLPASVFERIPLSTKDKHIVAREGPATIPEGAYRQDLHKFDVEGKEPNLKGEGLGEVHQAKAQFWPALKSLAMYSLRVEDAAMREPHWHPITAELGYVHKGQARMTIQGPDTSTDTYTLKPGDMYYIPAAYPHQIEVIPEGGKDIHFCIFFDQPMPQDIGYKAIAEGIPHEAMAATLGIKRADLPKLEGTAGNPLIVRRLNDVDKVKAWTK